MSRDDGPKIKYYFCAGNKTVISRFQTFSITPKDYFDREGFLYDSREFDPKISDFERIADSTFDYVGDGDPEEILLKHGEFMWRDMMSEIRYTYRRRRLLELTGHVCNSWVANTGGAWFCPVCGRSATEISWIVQEVIDEPR